MLIHGKIIGVNGALIQVECAQKVQLNEIAFVLLDQARLKAEVIRIKGTVVDLQVYEPVDDITVGTQVEFTGKMLTAQLGPGLLSKVYDGLQNQLPELVKKYGYFLQRGQTIDPLEQDVSWEWTPQAQVGQSVSAGDVLGIVPEKHIKHKIMVPFDKQGSWKLIQIAEKGSYTLKQSIAQIENEQGVVEKLYLSFHWPIKFPIEAYQEKVKPKQAMVTQVRVIDTFLPIAKGGTYCTPGPFGAGKTVLQQVTSRNADVDIVIIVACGERAGEVVETLVEFPELKDPRTGGSLMERTIIICNTSSMPVASRESSIYMGITLAEYYRQMGLDVLVLADSTSRWAQALREISGRLEEIPGEEAYPAYLESAISAFYERAGYVRLKSGDYGSVTINGNVSPAGGNFDEPVTQNTLKVVGAFHALSKDRSDARKYPAIDLLMSWSQYKPILDQSTVEKMRKILVDGDQVNQMMKVIGQEGISLKDYIVYLQSELIDAVYLQQNSFHDVDVCVSPERQKELFDLLWTLVGDTHLNFQDKEQARDYFYKIRQTFIDYNYSPWQSEQLEQNRQKLIKAIESAKL